MVSSSAEFVQKIPITASQVEDRILVLNGIEYLRHSRLQFAARGGKRSPKTFVKLAVEREQACCHGGIHSGIILFGKRYNPRILLWKFQNDGSAGDNPTPSPPKNSNSRT